MRLFICVIEHLDSESRSTLGQCSSILCGSNCLSEKDEECYKTMEPPFIPDYWISLPRQQQATESVKNANTPRPSSSLPATPRDEVRTANSATRCRARFHVPKHIPAEPPGLHHRPQKVQSHPPQDPTEAPFSWEWWLTNSQLTTKPNEERRDEVTRSPLADIISTTSRESNFTSDELMSMWKRKN